MRTLLRRSESMHAVRRKSGGARRLVYTLLKWWGNRKCMWTVLTVMASAMQIKFVCMGVGYSGPR